MEIQDSDATFATFSLGAFIQYRIDDGMAVSTLERYIQAYLNLRAKLVHLEPRSYDELRSQIEAVVLNPPQGDHRYHPDWLPNDEKQRLSGQ